MNLKNFITSLKNLPENYDVCLTSYSEISREDLNDVIESADSVDPSVLGNLENDEILVEVIDKYILGFKIDNEDKKIRFIIVGGLPEVEVEDLQPFKNKLTLLKKEDV